jgi:hypothetical protein
LNSKRGGVRLPLYIVLLFARLFVQGLVGNLPHPDMLHFGSNAVPVFNGTPPRKNVRHSSPSRI